MVESKGTGLSILDYIVMGFVFIIGVGMTGYFLYLILAVITGGFTEWLGAAIIFGPLVVAVVVAIATQIVKFIFVDIPKYISTRL